MSRSQGFPKSSRLLNANDYGHVFNKVDFRFSTRHFLLLARKNQNLGSRLGVIVAKKHVKLAVDRNRFKRVIRESFRQMDFKLENLDMIILAKHGLASQTNKEARAEIEKLWLKGSRNLRT